MSEVENPETAPVKYIRRIKMGRCNCVKNDANPNQPIVNRLPEQGILAVKVEEGVLPNFCWTNQATGEVGLDISGSRQQFELSRVREPGGEWSFRVRHFEERHREGDLYAFWLQETEADWNTVEAIRRVIEGDPATLLAEEREQASARLHRLSEESTPSPSVDEAGPSEPAPRLVPQPPRENFPHPIPRRPDPITVDQLAAEIVDGATKQAVFIQQAVENAGVADRPPQPIVETPASSIIADRLAGDIVDDAARQAVAINRVMGNAGIADRPPLPLAESSAAPIVEVPASAIIANQLAEDIVGDAPSQAVVIQRAVDNAGVADRAPQPIVEPSAAPTVVTTEASIIDARISKAVVAGAGRQAAIINHILENAGVADRPPQPLDEPSTAPIVDVPAGPVENVRDEKEEEPQETVKPLARAASPGGKRGHSPDEPTTKRNRRND